MVAYFAQIGDDFVVENVVVVPDSEAYRGQEYLAVDLGLGGTWVQTDPYSAGGVRFEEDFTTPSEKPALRHNSASIGGVYDPTYDVFSPPRAYASWGFNPETVEWEPPIPYPSDGGSHVWDEATLSWVEST